MNYVETSIKLSDIETVERARRILESKDLNLEDCVMAFLEQVVTDGNFPFDLNIPIDNDPTAMGMIESVNMARHPEQYKTYDTFQEMVNDIMKEED